MKTEEQPERETCHVIVFGPDGTEVLLQSTVSGFVFPLVEIPRWERLAENLTAAAKRELGCDVVCLLTPNNSWQDGTPNGYHYEVMECWSDEHVRGTNWQPVRSLNTESFQNRADFRTLANCLHELDGYERDPRSPFAQRGWLARARGWAADAIRPLGLTLGPSFRQYNASPSFSLIRLETNGSAVWFKAVGEPNLREFPITLKLAELFPRFIPEIFATKPEWHAWLSRETEGINLGEAKEGALWRQAATDLARLQIEAVSNSDSILNSGAHDLRIDTLLNAVDVFFEFVARLREEQANVPPPILSRDELSLLKLRIEDSLTLLEDLRIPNTLGHLDLNPWNIIVSPNECIFLDWAEAYVGPPFFSFEYLLQHFRRGICADAALGSELAKAYKAPWRQQLSDDLTDEALTLTPLAAVFGYAAGTGVWKDEDRLRDPKTRAYFRSLVRRMNREAIQFERRAACPS